MIAALGLTFSLGLFADFLGFKILAFSGMVLAIYGIFTVPLSVSLFFVFIYIGFEGFLKIVSNYHPVVHVGADLMVIALCLKALVQRTLKGFSVSDWPPLTPLFLIHFAWLFIIVFNPYSLSFVSSVAGAKIYASMVLLYFFGYSLISSEKEIRRFLLLFIGFAIVHSLVGLYQGYLGPESVVQIHPRYAAQLAKYQGFAFRPFGLTNLPGGPAIFLYPVIPFLFYFIYTSRSILLRVSFALFLPLAVNLFLLCQVRSALLKGIMGGLLFLLGTLYLLYKKSAAGAQRALVLTAVLGCTLLWLVPWLTNYSVESQEANEVAIERSLSLFDYDKVKNARRGTWERFVKYATEVPFGAGFARVGASAGAFSKENQRDPYFGYKYFFSDNLWLAALVEIGIPGMILFTVLLVMVLFKGITGMGQIQKHSLKILQLALMASLASVFLGSYGAEGLLYNPEACFFWFFSGVLVKIPELESLPPQGVAPSFLGEGS